MQITKIGTDYVKLNEETLYDEELINIPRVHLIELNFKYPSEKKINQVLKLYPRTNRFVIKDNIRIYNSIFRMTNKKYYVSNIEDVDIISFFKKNNKVLVNFNYFKEFELDFFLQDSVFNDLLKNVEVISINKEILEEKIRILNLWRGNCVIINKV